METNPIKIGKNSTWSSKGGKIIWIVFCLTLMVGIPVLVWFTAEDFYPRTFHNLIFGTPLIGFEAFMGMMLLVFGLLPKVKDDKSEES